MNPWREKFAYSNSRHNAWDSCKRAYFYSYIAYWDSGNPLKAKLWELKKLTKLIFAKGNIIHETCSSILGQVYAGFTPEKDWAMKILGAQFADATANPETKFLEYRNGSPLTAGDFKQVLAEAQSQVEIFLAEILPQYEGWDLIETETFYKDLVYLALPITIKLDALFESWDGIYQIDDFKTGKPRPEDADTSDQVTLYIWGMTERFGVPAESVTARLIFLMNGQVCPTTRTPEQIELIKCRVVDGSNAMLAAGEAEANYPPEPGKWKCRDCNFLTICPEGQGKK